MIQYGILNSDVGKAEFQGMPLGTDKTFKAMANGWDLVQDPSRVCWVLVFPWSQASDLGEEQRVSWLGS